MALKEHFIGIPNDLSSKKMKIGTHHLYIVVTDDCTWNCTDSNSCFPCFLAPGKQKRGTVHGPFIPARRGTVQFGAVPSSPDPSAPPDPTELGTLSGHTITVGGP